MNKFRQKIIHRLLWCLILLVTLLVSVFGTPDSFLDLLIKLWVYVSSVFIGVLIGLLAVAVGYYTIVFIRGRGLFDD